jgi:hypothetical protein
MLANLGSWKLAWNQPGAKETASEGAASQITALPEPLVPMAEEVVNFR